VIDEADLMFNESQNYETLETYHNNIVKKLEQKMQYILFSATYTPETKEKISTIIAEA
jgi:superfamily II DNA/RNA helicase